jgi:pyridoxamine 5'-phosphate oxidase
MGPIEQFKLWLEEARKNAAIKEPTAMCLATTDTGGQPSARIVLLKNVDAHGFVFYTNLESRKSREIRHNPKAALCFYWMPLARQVRIEGRIEQVSDAEADVYFSTRPRESRIGAWSSRQSEPLPAREALLNAVQENTAKFAGKDVPRPPFWSGWRVVPEVMEFWQQSDFRLHDREVFTRVGDGWDIKKLYP